MPDTPVMTPSEALMWAVERDPILRSTFLTITVLDRPPDLRRLEARIEATTEVFPRLHQRVRNATAPWERPHWVDDASFDLRYHMRHVALPPPGDRRALLDLAALWLEDAFDPVRPLWQLTVVEGLDEGGAAMLLKMHHTITDGVGGLRLSSSFLDFDAEGASPVRPVRAAPEPAGDGTAGDGTAGDGPAGPERRGPARDPWAEVARIGRMGRRAASLARPDHLVRQARDAFDTVASVARQSLGSGASVWGDQRSMGRHLDTIDLDLDEARVTAKALGGTVNDFFVTGVAGGAAAYHRDLGLTPPPERLRVAMPVSTRVDKSFGGNSFAPARVSVPVGGADPVARFGAAHQVLSSARSERALGVVDSVAAVILALPPAVLTPIARQQISTVDLAASNLRGSPVELFVAGGKVKANYPMGPTAGVAFNATVLSYMNRLDLGLVVDTAAVAEPERLRGCIEEEFAGLVKAARRGGA